MASEQVKSTPVAQVLAPAAAPVVAQTPPLAAPVAVPAKVAPVPTEPVFSLPPSVYSPELLESVAYEIEHYVAWFRDNRIKSKVGGELAPEPDHSAETRQVIELWVAKKPLTLGLLDDLLVKLRSLNLPVAHVTLAALPNHTQRQQLVDWFRATAGPNVLVSFVGDRNLGGGVLLRTPNRIFDYSWKQRLVEGRSKLAEVIRNV